MGPLLFLLFINELPDVVNEPLENNEEDEDMPSDRYFEVVVYADDNTPVAADADPLSLQTKTQQEADIVTDWFSRNDMICSSEKTKLLVVGTHLNRHRKLIQNNITLCLMSVERRSQNQCLKNC